MKTKFNIIQTLLIGTLITANSLYSQAQAPAFWGMTHNGSNAGTIYKTDQNGSNHSIEAVFGTTNGAEPNYTELLEASNGKLYGTTTKGGTLNKGVIFEYDISSNTQTKLYDFDNTNGNYPYGSLIEASNGKLYGTASSGGTLGNGVIFEYDILSNTQTKLYDFDNINGKNPNGSLIEISNGKLYGTASSGGSLGNGVIFEYNISSNTLTKLYDFDNTNGKNPNGSLIEASNGKLYGMTYEGGTSNKGVIFEYDISSNTQTKLYDFDNTNGSYPYGSLIEASNGKLYGMSNQGGTSSVGVIFEYDIFTNTQTKLFDFDNTTGSSPYGSLTEMSNGKLYGLSRSGGVTGRGIIFEYEISTNTQTKLYNFDNINGVFPTGSFMKAGNGKLYGMTSAGGFSNAGVIFEYDISTNTQAKLYDFDDNGKKPYGKLLKASNGKLYGMSNQGGTSSVGVIFEYDIFTNTQTKLYDFNNTNGKSPYGSLIEANNGKLYGMTRQGGATNDGVIFEYDISSNTQTKLYDFDGVNGRFPRGSLLEASNGKLYGITRSGGITGDGIIFEFDISTNTQTKLYDFDNTNGRIPIRTLIEANNGKLYGVTEGGGITGYGVIFEYDISTNIQTKLHDFDNTSGGFPAGALIEVSTGKLYGTTSIGGTLNKGVIFEFNILTNTKTNLYEFDGTNGDSPSGNLMEASNGKLYGITTFGGTIGAGVIFEYDISTGIQTKTFDFEGLNGVNPVGPLIEVIACQPTTNIDNQTACDSYTWIDGNTYTSDNNTATFTLTSAAGCDSLVTLDLTINSVDTTVTQAGATLTASASSATYQWLDCNNNLSQINGETAQTFTATSNGSYAVRVIANGCTDTSYCYTVMSTNITENDFGDELIIYPNPTNGNFAIDMGKTYRNIAVTITDLTGKILYQKNYNNTQQIQISITEPTGIYVLSIESENKKTVVRVIKE